MPSEELLEKVSHLPTTPGVLWRDQYNRIIYVGKAINLRNRGDPMCVIMRIERLR